MRTLTAAASFVRAAVLVAALSSPSLAQQRNPATIPTALATALLDPFSSILGTNPLFVVDRVPSGWSPALVPAAPWRAVGGVTLGHMRIALFSVPRQVDPTTGYVALLTRAGFRKKPESEHTAGGFVSGASDSQSFCDDSTVASVSTVDSTATRRFIVVMHGGGWQSSSCQVDVEGRFVGLLALPSLSAPRGAAVRRGGTSYGDSQLTMSATIDTTVSAAAVLEHYSAQLAAAGWTVAERPIIVDGLAVRQVSARDKKGVEWRGALLLIGLGESRELSLRMAKVGGE